MKIAVVSSSLDPRSRSKTLVEMCSRILESKSVSTDIIDLQKLDPPNFDNDTIYSIDLYRSCHKRVSEADALIFASPVYNWGCCAELKKFVEYVGSTPPEGSLKGAFYDKVLMFLNAGGLPHSYMAFTSLAASMMLDFKCIVSPYNVYVHNDNWISDSELDSEASARLQKSLEVLIELAQLLKGRTYKSTWEI